MYRHLTLQDPPKFAQIWIFGLKRNHLATLVSGHPGERCFVDVEARMRTAKRAGQLGISIFN
jgi:hypothetical protein